MQDNYAELSCRLARVESRFQVLGGLAVTAVALAILLSSRPPVSAQQSNGLSQRVAALETQVAALQTSLTQETAARQAADAALTSSVGTLSSTVTSQGSQIGALIASSSVQATQITALQAQTRFISSGTDENGYPATFLTGCNVWVQDGTGTTGDGGGPLSGLGNLIIGYNELGNGRFGDIRTGSHNLIVGDQNDYAGYGGWVSGSSNAIFSAYTYVTGGTLNAASGDNSAITGSYASNTSGYTATVTGGIGNTADGAWSSVSGGFNLFEGTTLGWSAGSLGATNYSGNFTSN